MVSKPIGATIELIGSDDNVVDSTAAVSGDTPAATCVSNNPMKAARVMSGLVSCHHSSLGARSFPNRASGD